jgi:hypothetical protein
MFIEIKLRIASNWVGSLESQAGRRGGQTPPTALATPPAPTGGAACPPSSPSPAGGQSPEDAATPEDQEPLPLCRQCGAPAGIFLAYGLRWQHFRGDAATTGHHEIYHPGHQAEVTWLLPGEDPEDL